MALTFCPREKELWSHRALLRQEKAGCVGVQFCLGVLGLVTALPGRSQESYVDTPPQGLAQEQMPGTFYSLRHLETSKEVGQMPTLSSESTYQKLQKCKEGEDAPGALSELPVFEGHIQLPVQIAFSLNLKVLTPVSTLVISNIVHRVMVSSWMVFLLSALHLLVPRGRHRMICEISLTIRYSLTLPSLSSHGSLATRV